ncbi:MAG: hypothetical protein K0S33_692 [Bacteroidetes bacterium]|jgi:predicted nucleotidyltransferase|nr:hypothetical protein [Bacteroidota bacterium]
MENKDQIEYLNQLAAKLKLGVTEKESIGNSVKNIKDKLESFFADDGLKEVIPFGSYDRDTLLTRKIDEESDVDILIVFDEKRWESQTYLNKLKRFAEENYPRSENYQDHPTIAIELVKIKFELVPCIYKEGNSWDSGKYLIPKKENAELEWIETNPNSLKNEINEYKKTKPVLMDLIHLYKYWNIDNGRLYSTFTVETFLLKHFDYERDLYYNFYNIIGELHFTNPKKEQNELSEKTKQYKTNIDLLIAKGMRDYALTELQKILPDIN